MRMSKIVTILALLAASAALFIGVPSSSDAQTTPKPALVRDVDNGDRAAIYQEEITNLLFEPAQGRDECGAPIPAGKRLVIEHVTTRVSTPIGQGIYAALKVGGLGFGTFIPLVPHGTLNGRSYYVGAQPVTLRADAGEVLCVVAEREPGIGQATVQVWIWGYLVNVP
jgi:hypothetical protein